MRRPRSFGTTRARPENRIPAHHADIHGIGDQRAGRDTAHAELRHGPEPEAQRAAKHDLHDRGIQHQQRRQLHVAGAAQHAGHRVEQPGQHGAAEKHLRVGDRMCQHIATAAEHLEHLGPEDQHAQHEDEAEGDADQERMCRERAGAFAIAGAERTCDGRRHGTAHGTARHGHGQDHCRKHQRHRGQRFHAETSDIGGLRDHHASTGGQRDHVRPGEAEQRTQDRPVGQRAPYRAQWRWQRTFFLIDRDLGDVRHFLSRA